MITKKKIHRSKSVEDFIYILFNICLNVKKLYILLFTIKSNVETNHKLLLGNLGLSINKIRNSREEWENGV